MSGFCGMENGHMLVGVLYGWLSECSVTIVV